MQWSCKIWRREIRESSYVQKKTQHPLIRAILWNVLQSAKRCVGTIRDLRRTDPKHMEMRNELYDECKRAHRQCWFSLDCKKVGGQKPWSVTTMSEMRKTYQQSAKTLYD